MGRPDRRLELLAGCGPRWSPPVAHRRGGPVITVAHDVAAQIARCQALRRGDSGGPAGPVASVVADRVRTSTTQR